MNGEARNFFTADEPDVYRREIQYSFKTPRELRLEILLKRALGLFDGSGQKTDWLKGFIEEIKAELGE